MADFTIYELPDAGGTLEVLAMSQGAPFDMFEFGQSSPVAINLSNVSPAGGSAIGVQAAWRGRLTLPSAVDTGPAGLDQIARVIVWVSYQGLTTVELALAGLTTADFSPDFSGGSSIVNVSPGVYDVTLIRNGGWPAAPRVFVHANSTGGGQT